MKKYVLISDVLLGQTSFCISFVFGKKDVSDRNYKTWTSMHYKPRELIPYSKNTVDAFNKYWYQDHSYDLATAKDMLKSYNLSKKKKSGLKSPLIIPLGKLLHATNMFEGYRRKFPLNNRSELISQVVGYLKVKEVCR